MALLTSSNLNGLMMHSIFFISGSFPSSNKNGAWLSVPRDRRRCLKTLSGTPLSRRFAYKSLNDVTVFVIHDVCLDVLHSACQT
jgi:hypothetical protein